MRRVTTNSVCSSKHNRHRRFAVGSLALWLAPALLTLRPAPAQASETSGDLPWNNFLDVLQQNVTGPTATAVIFIAFAGALVVWSMSDDNRGLVRFGKALGALAILAALGSLLSGSNSTLRPGVA